MYARIRICRGCILAVLLLFAALPYLSAAAQQSDGDSALFLPIVQESKAPANACTWEGDCRIWIYAAEGTTAPKAITSGSIEGLYGEGFCDTDPTWAPDFSTIAFWRISGTPPGKTELFTMDADGSNVQKLSSAVDHGYVSPDLRKVVYEDYATRMVHVAYLDGAKSPPVMLSNDVLEVAWSPNSTHFILVEQNGSMVDQNRALRLVSLVDGAPKVTFSIVSDAWDEPLSHPAWSPDGSQIAFSKGGSVFFVHADGKNLRKILRGGTLSTPGDRYERPLWWPVGNRLLVDVVHEEVQEDVGIYSVSSRIYSIHVDGSDLVPFSQATGEPSGYLHKTWMDRGQKLFFVKYYPSVSLTWPNYGLGVVDATTGEETRFGPDSLWAKSDVRMQDPESRLFRFECTP